MPICLVNCPLLLETVGEANGEALFIRIGYLRIVEGSLTAQLVVFLDGRQLTCIKMRNEVWLICLELLLGMSIEIELN